MRLILTLAAVLAAAPAYAQTPQAISPMTGTTSDPAQIAPPAPAARPAQPARTRMTLQQRFAAANTSNDGKLTLEQAKAGRMTSVARHFDAIDTGKKGYVTLDDIRTYNRAQRASRPRQPAQ